MGRPHVVVFPWPVQGHLTPMMQFSIKLTTYGIMVTFVTTEYRLAHILRAGEGSSNYSDFQQLTSNGEIRLVGLQDGLPDGNERNPVAMDFVESVGNLGGELERLLGRLSQDESLPPLTCIVSDSFMPWTQDVANKWNIPRVFFWTQSLAVCSSYMNISKLVAAGYIPFSRREYRLAHMLRAGEGSSNYSALQQLISNGEIRLVGLQDGLPEGNERNPVAMDFVESVDNLGGELERLLGRLSQDESLPPLTCIVSDSFMPWTQDVANKWNIPRVFFWTQSLAVCSSYMNISKLVAAGYIPFSRRVKYRGELPMLTCIPGLPAMDPYDLPFNSDFDFPEENLLWLRAVIDDQFRRVNEAAWVIANSFEKLESQVANHLIKESIPKLLLMGPLSTSLMGTQVGTNSVDRKFRASLWEEEEDGMQWLDTRREASVLYISFGSVVTKSLEVLKEMAMGLLACKQPFLWAARWGWEGAEECFPDEFWEFAKEEGKLTTWTPQLRVLSHPAVGGFLSHLGWNSTTESVSMGVPMLAWPCFLDQFTNSWSIAFDWKIGVEMRKVDGDAGVFVERGEVERAVRALMQGEEGKLMRRRAAQLQEDGKKAWHTQGGSSHRSLALFVEDMFRRAQGNTAKFAENVCN